MVTAPALEELARELSTKLNKLIIIINHWDNAIPHKDKTLLKFINQQFAPRRWENRPQPPSSPLTNVHDAGLFPAMAKLVTADQGLFNRSRYLQGEDFW